MADLNKLYGAAASLGGTRSVQPQTPVCYDSFWLCFKSGRKISYPYRYLGPVEIDEHEERVVIHCTCDSIRFINIDGERLSLLVRGLDARSIDTVRETPRPEFVRPGELIVVKIEVVRPPSK